jgi:D-alanyl-lipoteichoic acid acyltransferase DltB (MBOAT superfamily)
MLFNSFEYIIFFLPLTVILYFFLNSRRLTTAATVWLVFASLFFYSWWNISYLALIVGSILFNFGVGTGLGRIAPTGRGERSRKNLLIVGIAGNVLLLAYYKYTDFLIANISALGGFDLTLQKIILPLGISFFTFTQIAYLVDTYAGRAREYDFLNYSLFVTFFPHLLAGPIIHHKEMMPQFASTRNKVFSYRNMSHALFLFFVGLFKKVIIADSLAPVANHGFDTAGALTCVEGWVTSLSYTLQIYFDFSAYTDMALAASLIFNIRLPINFNSPYKAADITDFWRRWHMTLSRFLRDYIYIPLGGNRKGNLKTYQNLMATFLIGGLWHGAGWTFIFWGFLHGAASVVHRLWTRLNLQMPRWLGWFLTFNFVNIAWVFFRARTWDDATRVLQAMFGFQGLSLTPRFERLGINVGSLVFMHVNRNFIYVLALFIAAAVLMKNSNEMSLTFRPNWRNATFIVIIAVYALLSIHNVTEFLYFNF